MSHLESLMIVRQSARDSHWSGLRCSQCLKVLIVSWSRYTAVLLMTQSQHLKILVFSRCHYTLVPVKTWSQALKVWPHLNINTVWSLSWLGVNTSKSCSRLNPLNPMCFFMTWHQFMQFWLQHHVHLLNKQATYTRVSSSRMGGFVAFT